MPEETIKKPTSLIGLKSLVAAQLKEETDVENGTPEYEAVFPLEGVIDLTITPGGGEPDVQYAADGEYDVINPDGEYTITVETAGMHLADKAKLLGHKLDKNGVMMVKAGDKPPYFAIGFLSETSGSGDYLGVWILKTRGTPVTETFHTKEGETNTRQTTKLTFKGIKRTSDGLRQCQKEKADTAFLANPYAAEEVTTP